MAGRTLIDIQTRDELLKFLQELYQTTNVAVVATRASELYAKINPKWHRKLKTKTVEEQPGVNSMDGSWPGNV